MRQLAVVAAITVKVVVEEMMMMIVIIDNDDGYGDMKDNSSISNNDMTIGERDRNKEKHSEESN